ncbi:MAG: DUF6033 family protein, partial [Lachnospiraceae bacterium]|nr:DUF6033 family protein [Lachnospiraceae bacterium]
MNTNGVVASNYTKDYNNKVKNTTANSRTIGEPQLSEEAQKYYDQLKKKFSNYDFVLVSKDQIEYAKANIGKYAGGAKTAVLIDEEKIERMATDEEYRKKYEGILSGAANQIAQVKSG